MCPFPLIHRIFLASMLAATQLAFAETGALPANDVTEKITIQTGKSDSPTILPENKDTGAVKPARTATPGEVALRIAERLAAVQKARSKQHSIKIPSHKPAAEIVPTKLSTAVSDSDLQNRWRYEGEGGPAHWSEMSPEWTKCTKGTRQSPIVIQGGIKVNLEPIAFDYKPSRFTIIDNGHTIQVNLAAGNRITILGRTYELVQFHFHRPSEERVGGKAYDMVVHLMHRDETGKIAMIAVLIERGAAQTLIQTVWNNIPLEKNEIDTPSGTMDMNDILPLKRDYYTYMGSMTTPPCSEGVLWMVMKVPVSISQEQIDIFAHLYSMNARPIQPTFERLIKESH
jgi:carbonic anhydrase